MDQNSCGQHDDLSYLQVEDLGSNAAYLGPKIKKVFEMATDWDAVILLDGKLCVHRLRQQRQLTGSLLEADVFMAERSPADIERNELVSSKLPTSFHSSLTDLLGSLSS